MSAPRLFVPAIGEPGETVELPEDEARHVRSRRLAEGSEVVLLDGRGGRALAVLAGAGRGARVVERVPPVGEPARRVVVLLAAAEPARVEWAIEKGTECGAAAFLIAECERSQAPHVRVLRARLSRLSRIAAEAVKQCGRTCVPPVAPPRPLGELLDALELPVWLALPGAPPLCAPVPSALALVIGPEGGFSAAEEELFGARAATLFGLGARTLRMETATVAALSLLVGSS